MPGDPDQEQSGHGHPDVSPRTAGNTHVVLVLAAAVLLVVLVGWLMKIGQDILIPILTAVISVYILTSAADALGRIPGVRLLPSGARRLLVLLAFAAAVAVLASVVIVTAQQLVAKAPSYQANLEQIVAKISSMLGARTHPTWQTIREATVDRINVEKLIGTVVGSVGSIAGAVFAVVIYAVFLMAERNDFPKKLAAAIPEYQRVEHTCAILIDINKRIGDYLAVKTLINAILALISFAILWFWNVDYAVFWALLIGLLNYIPYVGSLLGVVFPVLLTLAQFGSLQSTLIVAAFLTTAQMWVGNALEPRMIGNKVNLSPFVVLVSLSVWSSLWGLPGAILAIPMTSMLSIVLGAFATTRPIAVLLTNDLAAFVPAETAEEADA